MRIKIPPLRERTRDIPLLIDFFTDKYCLEFGKSRFQVTRQMKQRLCNHHWAGNVRELEQSVRRAVLQGNEAGFEDEIKNGLPVSTGSFSCENDGADFGLAGVSEIKKYLQDTNNFSLKGVRQEFMYRAEKQFIKRALELASWNRKKAAGLLDISYKSLLNKMKEFGLT